MISREAGALSIETVDFEGQDLVGAGRVQLRGNFKPQKPNSKQCSNTDDSGDTNEREFWVDRAGPEAGAPQEDTSVRFAIVLDNHCPAS
jgi:hypothetical protein